MALYKYVTPERTDVLINKVLRFTQPCAFNDPFETFPCFISGIPDECFDEVLATYQPSRIEMEKMLEESFTGEMHKVGLKIPFETIKGLPFVQDRMKEVLPMGTKLMREFMSGAGTFFGLTIKLAIEAINRQFGLLCLAEKPDNLLMWAHYAASHSGFVLEFDENHSFFDRRERPKEFGRCLQKVTYVKTRPRRSFLDPRMDQEDFLADWVKDIFFSKSEHWWYEDEWRMVEYLNSCEHVIEAEPYKVYLFPLPIDCLTGIIFGCKASDETKSLISDIVRTDPNCSHIQLSQATIDEKDYALHISKIT